MSYIYKITNQKNQKVYIGYTNRTIPIRWKEHLKKYNQENLTHRHLYNAMKLYGPNNFTIEQIEECSSDQVKEREQYWIIFYNSYYDGYNDTLGGEGRETINSDIIIELFNQGKLVKEICNLTGYSKPSVCKVLDTVDLNRNIRSERSHKITSKPVIMLDINTNKELQVFPSANQAAIFCIGKSDHGHILQVCKGQRKTAHGYRWKFLNT